VDHGQAGVATCKSKLSSAPESQPAHPARTALPQRDARAVVKRHHAYAIGDTRQTAIRGQRTALRLPSQGAARGDPQGQSRYGWHSQSPPTPAQEARLSGKGLFDSGPLPEIDRLLLDGACRQVTQGVTASLARVE
jgi:hypothetical protein